MRPTLLINILLLFHCSLTQIVDSPPYQPPTLTYSKMQPCISYQQGNCASCPYNYHINQNQCYLNITHCLVYSLNNLGQ